MSNLAVLFIVADSGLVESPLISRIGFWVVQNAPNYILSP